MYPTNEPRVRLSLWARPRAQQVHTNRERAGSDGVLGPIFLGVFLTVAALKPAPVLRGLPVDLTVFLGSLTALAVAHSFVVRRRHCIRRPLIMGTATFAIIWATLLWSPTPSGEAMEKMARLFTLTLLAAISPLVLVQTRTEARIFLTTLGGVGALACLLAIMYTDTGRYAIADGSTITGGRVAGLGFVIATWWLFHRKYAWALVPLGLTAFVALGIGSRGPLAAMIVAAGMIILTAPWSQRHNALWNAVGIGLVALTLAVGMAWGPDAATARVASMVRSHKEEVNFVARAHLVDQALEDAARNPAGVGVGTWTGGSPGGSIVVYPHNIFVEILLEAGWVAGVVFAATVVASALGLWKLRKDPLSAAFLAVLAYWIINASISGDINGNRGLFALVSIGLLWGSCHSSAPSCYPVGHAPG